MGYTHYWSLARDLTDQESAAIAEDVRAIVAAAPCRIAGWNGTGEPTYGDDGYPRAFALNGADGEGCETFSLSRKAGWDFCKTRGEPYDMVVTATLLAVKARLGDALRLSSDGEPGDWEDGRSLAASTLHRPMPAFVHEETT